uniref:Uncharacterized protein FLJ21062 n=1 Tax=Plecturocebus moloch TaxID=9523 RepID=B0VXM1_PLEMO|nr:hypothetical protein [Plecturocebus moloch]
MWTQKAAATAEAQESGCRNKSSISRQIPVVGLVMEDDEAQDVFKPMDLNRVIKLLEETNKDGLEEKQLNFVKKLVQCYQNGLPLRDLAQIFKILNLCAGKIKNQPRFAESAYDIIKLCGLPFLKKKVSDEITYAEDTANSIALLGDLMKIPSSELRIQICKCIVDFYHAEPPKKHIPGYQQASSSYKIQMAEVGGLAKTMVQSMTLLENQLVEKLWVLKVLQHLSTSVKSQNILVKGLKISNSYEDFELKKLLFNIIVILCKDLPTIQLLIEGKVILALFTYVKKPEKQKAIDWSAAQYEELQLHAIATLSSVAPLLIEEYMSCQGNAQVLAFLEWCESEGIFKNIINKTNEKEEAIVLEMQSDVLLILSGLCEHRIERKEIFGTEGVDTVLHVMKTDPRKLQSGLGYNVLLFSTLDSIWCCILGCYPSEDYFLEKEGIFFLLDVLALSQKKFCNLILGIMVEFCDNPKTAAHVNAWRGKKDQTAASLLIKLWRKEEKELGVKRDKNGKIIDFENLPGLSAEDFVTLCIIHRYLDFKIGEIWNEINEEIKLEKLRPITTDKKALEAITTASENIGKMVASLQSEIIESQARQDVQNEQKVYAKIQATHKQRELANKSWENFLARTSNAKTLKKAKRLQEKATEASRYHEQPQNAIFHPTDIKGLNTTVPSGGVVTVESTPARLVGGPLADTDIALKKLPIQGGALQRVKAVKIENAPKKRIPT